MNTDETGHNISNKWGKVQFRGRCLLVMRSIIGTEIKANDLRSQSRCDGNSTCFRDKGSNTLNAGLPG